GLARRNDDAGLAREITVTGNAADDELEPDAWRDICAILDLNGLEANIIGVLERRDRTATIKGDIEFAWQTIERALIQNMKVPRARIGPCIDELAWTDSCRCVPSHIADIVGARTASCQAQILHALDNMDRVLRRDLPELQIGT